MLSTSAIRALAQLFCYRFMGWAYGFWGGRSLGIAAIIVAVLGIVSISKMIWTPGFFLGDRLFHAA